MGHTAARVPTFGKLSAGLGPLTEDRSSNISATTSITWRLLCSSFLVMTSFLIGDHNILPKQELHRSLQVFVLKPT